jgi:hypothetical protein
VELNSASFMGALIPVLGRPRSTSKHTVPVDHLLALAPAAALIAAAARDSAATAIRSGPGSDSPAGICCSAGPAAAAASGGRWRDHRLASASAPWRAAAWSRRSVRLRRPAVKRGTVVGNEELVPTGQRGTPRTYHLPVVAYTTPRGEKIRFTSRVGRGQPLPNGTPVRILFDPNHPEDAEIATFARLWLMPTVLVVLGLPFLLAGLFVLR